MFEIQEKVVDEGTKFNYTFPVDLFVDADGDRLSYNFTMLDYTEVPEWIRFSEENRTIEGVAQMVN